MPKLCKIHNPEGNVIDVSLTASEAIKCFCTECFCFQGSPRKECVSKFCPLYQFRGKSLAYLGPKSLTEEQKEQAAKRAANARSKRKVG